MYAGLSGKIAIVTGAAMSIGRGIARELVSCGGVVVVADIDDEAGARTAADLNRIAAEAGTGGRAVFLRFDLRLLEGIEGAVERVVADHGRLDVLVNNAAVVEPLVPLLDSDPAQWQAVVSANVCGTYRLSRAAARAMADRREGGSIVNILAIQSQSPLPSYSAYCASKGALEVLTRSMAVELAAHRIRVNGVAVGLVYADSVRRRLSQERYPAGQLDFEEVPPELDRNAGTLVGRIGRPSDVGRAVAFLASAESSFMSGSIMTVDGGRLLVRQMPV